MRPSIEDTMMEVAYAMSRRSTCSRRNNGAVIATENGVVLSTGYNGSLSGMPHCEHDCECRVDQSSMTGEKFHTQNCRTNKEAGCTIAVHAEANAIYFAARNGIRVDRSIIYCTTEPCQKCSEAIVQAGIFQCVYSQEYRLHTGIQLLSNAGVSVYRHIPGEGLTIVKM